MNTLRLALALLLCTSSGPALAQRAEPLTDFLGSQGCVIGPSTRALIQEAGYTAGEIEALTTEASNDPQTIRTGGWIVLPSDQCRIQPTDVPSEIRLTDPDVRAFISPLDGYAAAGFRGCFFTGLALRQVLPFTRGWTEDKAYLEWIRFMAENIRAGRLAFYGIDPTIAPPGFLVLTDDCTSGLDLAAIRHSQAVRDREFDAFSRANAVGIVCSKEHTYNPRAKEILEELVGYQNTNQWMVIEMGALATAVGPFFGTKLDRRSLPPFCHFE